MTPFFSLPLFFSGIVMSNQFMFLNRNLEVNSFFGASYVVLVWSLGRENPLEKEMQATPLFSPG